MPSGENRKDTAFIRAGGKGKWGLRFTASLFCSGERKALRRFCDAVPEAEIDPAENRRERWQGMVVMAFLLRQAAKPSDDKRDKKIE